MKRFATLAATFALSTPCAADAEEPQPNPARPKIVVERPKAEPAAPKPAPQVQGAQAGATLPIATVPNQAAVAVTQVTSSGAPGGTVEIQIREAANAAEFAKANAELQQKHAEIQRKHAELQQKVAESQHNAQAQQEAVQRRLEVIVKQQHAAHRAGMRERVSRQRELTKQATKLIKKLDELGSDESPKARDLWKQLEQTQAQLQQTLGAPQAHTFSLAPGQPADAWVVRTNEGQFGGTVTGGGLIGGAGFGGAVSSGNVIISSSPQFQAQANPAVPHVRELKVHPATPTAAPQPSNAQPSNAEVLKALEALNVRIKMLEELISKSSRK